MDPDGKKQRPARLLAFAAAAAAIAAAAAPAFAETGGATGSSAPPAAGVVTSTGGGAMYVPPAGKARLVNGRAIAPADAPPEVRRVIAFANRIVSKPYRYGGGHRPFAKGLDRGYDCSGAVSYALFGGGFLDAPLDSGSLMRWGKRGRGRWITVYAHGGHTFLVVAGLRFDTGYRDAEARAASRRLGLPRTGPRWSRKMRPTRGYVARHPAGF